MRRHAAAALAAVLIALPAAAQTGTLTPTPGALPYDVTLTPVTIPGMPALHSFAAAQHEGEWLLVTGRRNGLHTIDTTLVNAFPPRMANDSVYVVDPVGRQVWSAGLSTLPADQADALTVSNANAWQDGEYLYVIGGYGQSTTRADSMLTFPTLTAIDVPAMIAAVKGGTSLAPAVQQADSFALKVAGGQLLKMGEKFYLVMGQRFDGLYSANPGYWDQFVQIYTERVMVLSITPDPLSFTIDTILAQNPDEWARNFHRRDLNVVGQMMADGSRRLAVYGGVFVPGQDAGYQVPVYVNDDNTTEVDSTFFQAMSQYDAAYLPLFDGQTMYTTLFGGISLYWIDEDRQQLHRDSGLPFIDDVSVIAAAADGTTRQWAYPWTLPGLMGSDAKVLLDPSVPQDEAMGIVRLDQLTPGEPTRVGWLYGGIVSSQPQTDDQAAQTKASDAVFEVIVTRAPTAAYALPTSSP